MPSRKNETALGYISYDLVWMFDTRIFDDNSNNNDNDGDGDGGGIGEKTVRNLLFRFLFQNSLFSMFDGRKNFFFFACYEQKYSVQHSEF